MIHCSIITCPRHVQVSHVRSLMFSLVAKLIPLWKSTESHILLDATESGRTGHSSSIGSIKTIGSNKTQK